MIIPGGSAMSRVKITGGSPEVKGNSIILKLDPELTVYEHIDGGDPLYHNNALDIKKPSAEKKISIPYDGIVLIPNKVYSGFTKENISCKEDLCAQMEGLFENGKIGLFVHSCGGFGGSSFDGKWPITLHCVQPVRIYPLMPICQVFFSTTGCEWDKFWNTGCPVPSAHNKL